MEVECRRSFSEPQDVVVYLCRGELLGGGPSLIPAHRPRKELPNRQLASDLFDAARKLARDVEEGKLDPDRIDEKVFAAYLYAPDVPDPDLLIRTGDELRVSNFLLWQTAYTEIYTTPTMWPDFSKSHLIEAIVDYQQRERRFGMTSAQVSTPA